MKIHRLYADKNGESHFQDVEVEYAETTRAGRLSKRIAATGIIFREVQPDYDLDWHPAPRRQYIINLDAGVQITASDGEARRIGAGEVILVEDTWGQGPSLQGPRRRAAPLHLRDAGLNGCGGSRRATPHPDHAARRACRQRRTVSRPALRLRDRLLLRPHRRRISGRLDAALPRRMGAAPTPRCRSSDDRGLPRPVRARERGAAPVQRSRAVVPLRQR